MEWLADDKSEDGLGLSLARMTVLPGKTSPAHRHPNCNEVIHVLAGQIEERRNENWHTCHAGETIIIPAGNTHQTRCTGSDPAILMIAYSDGTRIYEDTNL